MELLTQIVLWSSAVLYALIGLVCFVRPDTTMNAIGIGILNDTGRVDIRATYGGLLAGLGGFFLWAAVEPSRYEAGLYAVIFVYGGLALGRLLAILAKAKPKPMMWIFLLLELGYVVAGAAPLLD